MVSLLLLSGTKNIIDKILLIFFDYKDELRWIKNFIATNKKRTFKSYLVK